MATQERYAHPDCSGCVEMGIFDIDDQGIIRSPGRFESEPDWALHFYHYMMDGGLTLCACGTGDYGEIEQEDIDLFPALAPEADQEGARYVHLEISDQGFLYVGVVTQAELDHHEEEAETENDQDFDQ